LSLRLVELEPEFLVIVDEKTTRRVDSLAEADGVMFLCPKCFEHNQGPVGTHMVICWRPRVPLTRLPGPGRWEFEGTGCNDLTLVAGSSSVLLQSWCRRPGCEAWHGYPEGGGPPCVDPRCAGWHGFIRAGAVISV
jgi:hypothetical protein